VIPASDRVIAASDRVIPASDRVIAASDRVIPASDRVIPASDRVISAGRSPPRRPDLAPPRSVVNRLVDNRRIGRYGSSTDRLSKEHDIDGGGSALSGVLGIGRPDPT
jgi:hypothetical protein